MQKKVTTGTLIVPRRLSVSRCWGRPVEIGRCLAVVDVTPFFLASPFAKVCSSGDRSCGNIPMMHLAWNELDERQKGIVLNAGSIFHLDSPRRPDPTSLTLRACIPTITDSLTFRTRLHIEAKDLPLEVGARSD